MNKKDVKPGTKVIVCIDYTGGDEKFIPYSYAHDMDYHTCVGTILDKPTKAGWVWVAWKENDDFSEDEESEVEIKLLTLESDRSKIEQEFQSCSKQIQDKMVEAATLIREANVLAKKAGVRSLCNMYNEVSPLIVAMDDAGWQTSSWGC